MEAELERYKQDIISVAEYFDEKDLLSVVMGDQNMDDITDDLVLAVDKIVESRKHMCEDESHGESESRFEKDATYHNLVGASERLYRPSTVEIRDVTDEETEPKTKELKVEGDSENAKLVPEIEDKELDTVISAALEDGDEKIMEVASESKAESNGGKDEEVVVNTESKTESNGGKDEEVVVNTELTDNADDVKCEMPVEVVKQEEKDAVKKEGDVVSKEGAVSKEEETIIKEGEDSDAKEEKNASSNEEDDAAPNAALKEEDTDAKEEEIAIPKDEENASPNKEEDTVSKAEDNATLKEDDTAPKGEDNTLCDPEDVSVQSAVDNLKSVFDQKGKDDFLKLPERKSPTESAESFETGGSDQTHLPILFSFENIDADYERIQNIVVNKMRMCYIDFFEFMRDDGSGDGNMDSNESLDILKGVLQHDSISYSNGFFISKFPFSLLKQDKIADILSIGDVRFVCRVKEAESSEKKENNLEGEQELFLSTLSDQIKVIFVTESNILNEIKRSLHEIVCNIKARDSSSDEAENDDVKSKDMCNVSNVSLESVDEEIDKIEKTQQKEVRENVDAGSNARDSGKGSGSELIVTENDSESAKGDGESIKNETEDEEGSDTSTVICKEPGEISDYKEGDDNEDDKLPEQGNVEENNASEDAKIEENRAAETDGDATTGLIRQDTFYAGEKGGKEGSENANKDAEDETRSESSTAKDGDKETSSTNDRKEIENKNDETQAEKTNSGEAESNEPADQKGEEIKNKESGSEREDSNEGALEADKLSPSNEIDEDETKKNLNETGNNVEDEEDKKNSNAINTPKKEAEETNSDNENCGSIKNQVILIETKAEIHASIDDESPLKDNLEDAKTEEKKEVNGESDAGENEEQITEKQENSDSEGSTPTEKVNESNKENADGKSIGSDSSEILIITEIESNEGERKSGKRIERSCSAMLNEGRQDEHRNEEEEHQERSSSSSRGEL